MALDTVLQSFMGSNCELNPGGSQPLPTGTLPGKALQRLLGQQGKGKTEGAMI